MLVLPLCACTVAGLIDYANRIELGDVVRKTDIRIFKNTEAWDLAVAVKNQDVKKIEKIAEKNPELLNFQDPYYCTSLLIWAVGMEKYKSAEALLKCGADPNVVADGREMYKSKEEEAVRNGNFSEWRERTPAPLAGATALYVASGYSWIDTQAKKDAKYVNLLLEYGADPNICYTAGIGYFYWPDGRRLDHDAEAGRSPLINSISCGIEKTKALVEAGADINHKTESGETAAISALTWGGGPVLTDMRRYAHYLIVEKKAIVKEPYYTPRYLSIQFRNSEVNEFYPVDILRKWVCKLDSEDYKLKMEIVKEFARQGVDYWATEISQKELKEIKYRYPDTWEEYIKVY